jgi:hypothetical protein
LGAFLPVGLLLPGCLAGTGAQEWDDGAGAILPSTAMQEVRAIPEIQAAARAVVILVDRSLIGPALQTMRFADAYGAMYGRPLCSDIPFREQPVVANADTIQALRDAAPLAGSAFLVAADQVATVGHFTYRFGQEDFCARSAFVFDHALDESGGLPQSIDPDDVYYCKQVLTASTAPDTALILLDRPVVDRLPLALDPAGATLGAEVYSIGHSFSLPQKASLGAAIHGELFADGIGRVAFHTNLDNFPWGAGAPVLSRWSHLVVGVHNGGISARPRPDAQCDQVGCDPDVDRNGCATASRESDVGELVRALAATAGNW